MAHPDPTTVVRRADGRRRRADAWAGTGDDDRVMTIAYLLTFVGVLVFVALVSAMALVPTALDLEAAADPHP